MQPRLAIGRAARARTNAAMVAKDGRTASRGSSSSDGLAWHFAARMYTDAGFATNKPIGFL